MRRATPGAGPLPPPTQRPPGEVATAARTRQRATRTMIRQRATRTMTSGRHSYSDWQSRLQRINRETKAASLAFEPAGAAAARGTAWEENSNMGFHMRPRAENSPMLAKILKLLDDATTMIAKFPNPGPRAPAEKGP